MKRYFMKVQKFEGLPLTNQVFNSNKNVTNYKSNKNFYDIDSTDSAVATDSLNAPLIPQIVEKIKKAYRIAFPNKIVTEAENIKTQIDDFAENHRFQAVA